MRACALVFFASAVLAGCGGGGSYTPTSSAPGNVVTPAPPVAATASKAIDAASGGAVSTVLNGETVTVTIPAGALSASTSATLSVYANAGLPRQFQSRLRRPEALPTGASFICGMGVSIGSATLLKPLIFSVAGAPNAVAGTAVRLAASSQGAFGDIDTATQTSGVISQAQNPAYAGASLAGPSILYAFYRVPAASALAAPAIVVTVSGPSSVPSVSQAQYAAAKVDANGFPFLTASYTYSVDLAAIGAIDPTTGMLTTAIGNNTLGHVVATDRLSGVSGSLPVSVLSSRPANAGDAVSYAGSLSISIANNAIAANPVVSTQVAKVTQAVGVGAGAAGQVVVTDNEFDDFQLSTLTTQTVSTLAYQNAGTVTAVRLIQSTATDSNNAVYQTQYTPTSGLLTVEPENAGTFGPNDASQTYSETDPGVNVGSSGQNVTTTRIATANGAYQETTTNADGSTNNAIQNADGTGSYAIESAIAGPIQLTFGLPTTVPPPTIPIDLIAAEQNVNKTINPPSWYPASPLVVYAESDAIAAATGYDTQCTVPAKYGTASSKVTQTITSVDAVYGNLETQSTTTYDVVGVGTVCSIFTDTTQTFYDYTGQEPKFITFNTSAAPILSSSITEVLSITAATVAGQPVSTASHQRSTLAIGRLASIVGRERFRHAVRQAKITQSVRMAAMLRRLQGVH